MQDRPESRMGPARSLQQLLPVVLLMCATSASAQSTPDQASSQSESGLTLAAEVFCSDTKLRTGNVRVRWSLSPAALSTAGLASLAAATQSLDATVFAGGFEKGLYVTVPVPAATPSKPVAPVAQASVRARKTPLRAYQIQLIEVAPPRVGAAAEESGEMSAVIENLEPGVNYTWRLNIETASGKLVSAPITVQAPTCPADMVEPTPRRRP